MIDGKVLKFGYGDICIGHTGFNLQLTFRGFKPPKEIGERILKNEDIEFLTDTVKVDVTIEECFQLKSILNNIEEYDNVFEFKGYVFDFTKNNTTSLKVLLKQIDSLISRSIMCLAC